MRSTPSRGVPPGDGYAAAVRRCAPHTGILWERCSSAIRDRQRGSKTGGASVFGRCGDGMPVVSTAPMPAATAWRTCAAGGRRSGGPFLGASRLEPGAGYDVANLSALRKELARLNETAWKDGLVMRRDGGSEVRSGRPVQRVRRGSARTGKVGARRLIEMLGPVGDDRSPLVPGTDFTEDGVVRLLAHLRKPRMLRYRFFRRLLSYLARPVAGGVRASAGVSVERLQVVSRQLLEIKARGWYQFQSIRAARRGGQANPHG